MPGQPALVPVIRVVIADDHALVRAGIAQLLAQRDDIRVVGEAADGEEAVRVVDEHQPDLVLMDLSMPELDGIAATRQIKARNPRAIVIALSARTDAQSAHRILEAGATDYLRKNAAFSQLASSIRSAFAMAPSLI